MSFSLFAQQGHIFFHYAFKQNCNTIPWFNNYFDICSEHSGFDQSVCYLKNILEETNRNKAKHLSAKYLLEIGLSI